MTVLNSIFYVMTIVTGIGISVPLLAVIYTEIEGWVRRHT